ncbi:MAG: endolytic transglycosylase MltG [Desulfoplanes sp.]|nr:endolytic transglycosylase MltG [Desulfoplanes sp.]
MIRIRLSRIQGLVLLLISGLLLLAGILFFQAHQFLHTPPQSPGTDVIIQIEKGQSFGRVAALLESKQIITNRLKFKLLGRFEKQVSSIQAGEFRLNTGWLPRQVLKELTQGQSVLHSLTIPEGLTWWQIAERIEQAGLGTAARFKAVIHDPAFLTAWNIPAASAEGYLFPETYRFSRSGTDPAEACAQAMIQAFHNETADLLPPKMPPSEIRRILILASLVEKETGMPAERARIAGVYVNRLARSMRLQCDPTIIYGIGPDFNGNLTRKDILNRSNIYNTYAHEGLPPGPICSPGREAILAALHPEKHTFLYFVARGDGGHVFSKTLDKHNRAVQRYQLHSK